MISLIPSHERDLSPFLNSVRGHFQTGGSLGVVLAAIVGILLMVGMVCWAVMVHQEKKTFRGRENDPKKLYSDLMNALVLPKEHRQLLTRIAKDMRLPQPAVIFLSPKKFDSTTQAWCASRGVTSLGNSGEQLLAITEIREKLFSLR